MYTESLANVCLLGTSKVSKQLGFGLCPHYLRAPQCTARRCCTCML